ncbi:hypothetical protein GE21DRAFT_6769 [Neurospora crassa]|uniref:Uncharacterized protein n=1 Tax=Neurospora crassa (strain ATCC 24698 / 74-OR23-1A / CBS 708.71 / DSM 1257 / FGSC 987) TaxID=367110 RepID=Q7S8G1_NEUCR|nr:hypothetical protein NCU05172 [Neurospora crassa OR74A]EAA32640.3 hypothetical protein NCU05172 [Neurospora crassa OR74A]KHE79537.1 hypothetical protein GE21DRAFT_6769 [Neurospora crassa]|eukprot:XP_961876.3 hypothetical protein NCU05172 [Neurospora crassa OR74A]
MNYAERLQEIWSLIPQQPEGNDAWDYVQNALWTLTRDIDNEIRQNDEWERHLVEQEEALGNQDRELAEKEQSLQEREQTLLDKEQAVQTREHDLDRREQAVKDKEHQLELHAKLDLILEKMDNNATKEQVRSVSDSVQNMASQQQVTATQEQVKVVSKALETVLNDSATKEQVTAVSKALDTLSKDNATKEQVTAVSKALDTLSKDNATKEQVTAVSKALDTVLNDGATKEQVTAVSKALETVLKDGATKEQVTAVSNSLNTMSHQVQAIPGVSEKVDAISDQMKQVGFVSESLQNVVQFMEGVSHMLHTVSGQLSQIWNDSSTKDLVWRGMSKLWDQLLEMSSVMNSQNRTRSETLELISSQISQVNNDKATKEQVQSALTKLDTLSENGATQELVRSVSTTVGSVLAKFDGVASKQNLKVLYGLYRHLALQLAAMANDHDIRLSDIESDLQNIWGWVENLCDGDTNSLAVVLKEVRTNKDWKNTSYDALASLEIQLQKVQRLEQELEDFKSTNFDLDNQIQDQCARLDKLNDEVSRSRELLAIRPSCSIRSVPPNNRRWVQRVDDLLDKLDRFIVADTQEGPLEAIFNQFCVVMSDPDVRALNNLDLFNAGPPVDRWYCFKRIIHSGPTTDAIPHDGQISPSWPPNNQTHSYPATLPRHNNNNNNNNNHNNNKSDHKMNDSATMTAPSMPLDAQKRRSHIMTEIKKAFGLEESFVHRMMADIFAAKAHENLWRQKFASVCPNVRNWLIDLYVVKWFFPEEMSSLYKINYPLPAPSAETSPEYAAFREAKIQERDGTFVVPDTSMWQQLRPQVGEGHPGVYGRFHIILPRELSPASKVWHELESKGQQDKFGTIGLVRVRISLDVAQRSVVYQLGYSTVTPLANPYVMPALGQTWLNFVGWACELLLMSHNPQLQPSYPVWLEKHVANGCPPHNEERLVETANYARMVATFKTALLQAERLLAGAALDDITLQQAVTECEKLCSSLHVGLPSWNMHATSKLLVWAALHNTRGLDPYVAEHYPRQGLGVTVELLRALLPKFCQWKGRQYVEHWIKENPLSLPRTRLEESVERVLKDMNI